jgi:hypothetical protein
MREVNFGRARATAALLCVAFAAMTGSASATDFPVSCTDANATRVANLKQAVVNANATTAADSITITNGPCVFSFDAPASTAANNNNSGVAVTQPLTINGNSSTFERASGALLQFRLILVNGLIPVTINNLTVANGRLNTGQVGAGIASLNGSLTLDGVRLEGNIGIGNTPPNVQQPSNGNQPANGGGMWTFGGSLSIDHSTFNANQAGTPASVPGTAGALATNQTSGTIRRTTFSNNSANSGGAAWVQGGTLTFENDTFSKNTANNGLGGIITSNYGTIAGVVNVAFSTFADQGHTGNTAPGGALFNFPNPTVGPGLGSGTATTNVTRSIVADTDSAAAATSAPCSGVTATPPANTSIEWPGTTCNFGNTVNPQLSALAANGGPTQTLRPLPASPAIDLAGTTGCPATDQRDVARPDGEACDTGSYETPAPQTQIDSAPTAPTNNPQFTFSSPDTPGATFECKIDAGSFAACSSPYSPIVADGTHTAQVRGVSSQGYVDKTPASATFTVDKTAPTVVVAQPASPTPDDTPTFTFTVNDAGATVTCQVDSGPVVDNCTSPYTTPPLSNGSHTLKVTATDAVGNVGSDQKTVVVDIAAPQVLDVPCGDVAELRAKITSANQTFAPDTINVTGGPCTFTLNNSVDPASGGNGLPIVVHPLIVEGHGSTIERSQATGTPDFRIWFVSGTSDAAAKLTLRDLTILRGKLSGSNIGAGVASFLGGVDLQKVVVAGNSTTGQGGGVATIGGTLDVDHSTLSFNTGLAGGGLSVNVTPTTVRRSLFFANSGTNNTGGALVQGSNATFENDTVAANAGANGVAGIAILSSGATPSTATVASTTLYNNRRTGVVAPAGALWAAAGSTIHATDTIVTDDSTAAAAFAPCTGAVVNDGGNLEWPGTSCGFATNANPKLGAATAWSGGASYYPLLSDSPAIDLGGADCPGTDQRDAPRPDGAACDAGAFEAPEPETALTGPANDPTNDTTVTFSSPDTPGATFQCKVDNGAYAACTSPYAPALSDGQHTITVRAVAAGGYVDRTPASTTFTVDKTAPVVDITSAPPALTPDNTPAFEFTVNDPSASVTCQIDSEPVVMDCTSPYTSAPLTDGPHTFTVRATDPVGNTGSDAVSFTVDTVPAQTFDVACGDVAALRAAIASANATLAHDTINVTGGPCTFTLHDSVNPASGGNGLPIVVHPLTVEGHGSTIERSADSGTPNFRIWFVTGGVDAATTLTLRDMTILRGSLAGGNAGAGVASFLAGLTLEGVTVQSNTTNGNGGGVGTLGGSLDVDHSSFYFNQAATAAALATTLTPGKVQRSTFYLNGGTSTASGATAWVQGETVTFENDTIAGNAANNGIGGIVASNSGAVSGVVNVVSSTLFANRKTGVNAPAGHLFTFHQSGAGTETIHVTDSIVTDTATAAPALAACTGAVVDEGGNIEWPGTSCGFATHADPQLDTTIGLHGGKTFNYRLLPGSPAIDLGGATCPATDQRDVSRPDGDGCDAGSYETPAPETEAHGPTSVTNAPSVTFSSPDTANATFECRIDNAGAWTVCTSPYSPSGLSDGQHSVQVRAVNAEGYKDPSPASVTFTVDKTAPVVDITSGPPSPGADDTPEFTFTVDDPDATVTCQVDTGPQVPCSSPYTTPQVPEGKHTFTVRATDAAGNTGSDSVAFAVSFGPPDTTITSGPSGTIYNQTSATFTFTSSKPNSTFECRLDSAAFAACTSPHTVSGYSEGTHTFQVRAIDIAGVPDPTPASRTFTYKHCNVLRVITNVLGQPVVICL